MSVQRKIHLRPPNGAQLAKIRLQLFEDDDKLANHLQLLKKWIDCESYLPNNVDDALLANFIRLSKYNLERAKRKFETYIIVKNDLLKSVNVELTDYDFEETDLGSLFLMLPDLTPDGHRILYGKAYNRVDTFDINKALTYSLDICDIILHSDINAGYVLIFDAKSFTLNFMTKVDLSIVKAVFNIMLNIQPGRVHCFHVINISPIGKTFFSMLKSIMSEKMKKRVIIHGDEKELLKHIGKELLPPEVGGCNISIPEMVKQWQEYMVGNEDLKERKRIMALRNPIPKNKAHLDPSSGFGLEGSFRKIQID